MDSRFPTNYITGLEVLRDRLPADSYTLAIPALRSLENLDFPCPVTFFTGENGSGKSTLLEAVAVAYGFNPEGGTRNFQFSTRDTHSDFSSDLRLRKGVKQHQDGFFLRAESFYNVASKVDDLSLIHIFSGKFIFFPPITHFRFHMSPASKAHAAESQFAVPPRSNPGSQCGSKDSCTAPP